MDSRDTKNIVTIGATALGLYWLYNTFVRDENAKEGRQYLSDIERALRQSQRLQPSTRNESAWGAVAEQIFQALDGGFSENLKRAETLMKEPNNTTDILMLDYRFGYRQFNTDLPFVKDGAPKTLRSAIQSELDEAAIKRINDWYSGRNIDYRI